MSEWRPADWECGGGYQDEVNGELLDNYMTRTYEAGADAMLAALRGKTVFENHVDGEWVYVHMRADDIKGYTVVFIPDEKA